MENLETGQLQTLFLHVSIVEPFTGLSSNLCLDVHVQNSQITCNVVDPPTPLEISIFKFFLALEDPTLPGISSPFCGGGQV